MQLPTTSPDHAGHDPLLIAGLADRAADALTADEQRVAEALVASCVECASLHADLVALTAATTTSAIPTRPRDYRLTEADAHRLRPRGWRRWLADIGSPRDAFSRPLAVGLTTLGLAGLLVATVPTVLPGVGGTGSGTASDPAAGPVGEAPAALESGALEQREVAAPYAAASQSIASAAPDVAGAAPSSEIVMPAEGLKATSDPVPAAGRDSTGGDAGAASPDAVDAFTLDDASGAMTSAQAPDRTVLLVLGGVLFIGGLGLFGLRRRHRISG